MDPWESYLVDNRSRFLDELCELLRIPSVAALPEHDADVRRAADWLARRLETAGMEAVRVMPTGGHPVVYGEWQHAPGKPTVLIYGHFDVQPADPFDLWTSPPFEPAIRDGRLYARGASDMKGDLVMSIFAVEALLRTTGSLPVNVKFLLEGQEEIASPQLPAFVAANTELLACDVIVNADGTQWSESEPALVLGLRGLCLIEIDVYGASTDLHSGLYGGAIQNPLHALAELLASMHDPDGRIAVEGFYDDVSPLSQEDRARLAAVPFDEADYRVTLGVDELFGEPGFSTLERTGVRPTLDVNGMWGGFQGEGVKTVLPREAHAKITCRLVPDQDPARILDRLVAHVQAHAPRGVRVVTRPGPVLVNPFRVPSDHPGNQAAHAVLVELYGREPYCVWMGGSVPVTDVFRRHLGAYAISFGFALPDEKFHAPDEFLRLTNFDRGQIAYGRLLEKLGELTAAQLRGGPSGGGAG